jgi:TP901 family phage tail tape measure protein
MAETTREMVVRLSMDAGGFKKTASEINRQIRNIDKEIKGMGGDPSRSQLEEKLGLQQKAVENLEKAVEQARKNFVDADTDAKKLMAAKQLSGLETQLTTAEAKAQALKNQLSAANLIKFGTLASNFGKSMQRMGRTMSLYVSGPLMALGGKAYKAALDFESATVSMQKTIDETDTTKYADIEAAFKSLSETTPVGYTELMELAGQAGALGVSADEVIEFVKSVAMISETADDLDASSGADVLARFLNVTDQGSFENITRTASAVTALGNNLATTEGELLAMAQRMASTGELAGMSNEAILALAAGLTSVGINAEAGGSAAGKLMKQMQLAGETGRRAMQEFSEYSETAGLSPRDLQLAADSSKWVEATAIDLGRTKKEIKDMVASMVALEQFSGVMNVTPAQFIAGWNENAGQSVLDFFIGLNEIETSTGEESVLSKLQEMGLTEIRLSNMIAAAAANPDIFVRAMEISNEAYAQNTALAEEAEKRYATAESYQRTQLNRMENAAADAGENLVDPIQNIMTKITDLLGKFGELDEGTQNWILGIGGGLAVGGPALVGLGSVVSAVGKITTAIGKARTSTSALQAAISSPTLWGVVAGVGAVSLLVAAIESIESPSERIVNNLKNIKVELDEETYNATMSALAEVKAQTDVLSGETGDYNRNVSAAVKAGYGTADMYGTALGYEAAFAQNQITEIAGKYASEVDRLNGAIGAETDKGRQAALAEQRDAMLAQWDAETQAAKQAYVGAASALVSGMMQAQPEAKAALEQAAQDYDLLVALMDAMDFAAESYDDDAVSKKWAAVFTPDVIEKYFPDAGEILPGRDALSLYETLLANMETALKASGGENSLAYTLWKSILDDPLASGLFDQTKTTGALDGIIELMDFKTAGEQAGMNFGDALTPGLADGIDGAAAPAVDAMDALEAQLVDKAAKMGAAVASAFNNNLNFRLPNATGGGVNVNVNSPTAMDIYKIRKGLTDASRRAARGYGAG